ncbi:MAG: translation elongation factor-like protein [Candidatus Aenigmarchaeota archaeon]|nr:translation elongation factor-like protein [Candidatus Aenigmarchaeota archaeon]MCX8190892.1 translation elongation factor-like protein [Candidatus Aenigmarchaeota archaeon]MDW8159895.1 translation elongation factor-like protein [Candidatus Aenigmarchaeota archaeon]
MEKIYVGEISHYYPKISVAVLKLENSLRKGDKISIEGYTTNFSQVVESMQIEHKNVEEAKKGDSIGLKVVDRVRVGDKVYKIVE